MTRKTKLRPIDLLVYANIKRFQDKQSKTALVSYKKISSKCGISIPSVVDSIKSLEETNYIKVSRNRTCNLYSFTGCMRFERFSMDFLDNEDLSPIEKGYLLAIQQYCLMNPGTKRGMVEYSNCRLSDLINMPASKITLCNKSLEKKGFLQLKPDPSDRRGKQIKYFDMIKLDQALLFTVAKHEKRITDLEEATTKLASQVDERRLREMMREEIRKDRERQWAEEEKRELNAKMKAEKEKMSSKDDPKPLVMF